MTSHIASTEINSRLQPLPKIGEVGEIRYNGLPVGKTQVQAIEPIRHPINTHKVYFVVTMK